MENHSALDLEVEIMSNEPNISHLLEEQKNEESFTSEPYCTTVEENGAFDDFINGLPVISKGELIDNKQKTEAMKMTDSTNNALLLNQILYYPDAAARKGRQIEKMPFVITSSKWKPLMVEKE